MQTNLSDPSVSSCEAISAGHPQQMYRHERVAEVILQRILAVAEKPPVTLDDFVRLLELRQSNPAPFPRPFDGAEGNSERGHFSFALNQRLIECAQMFVR